MKVKNVNTSDLHHYSSIFELNVLQNPWNVVQTCLDHGAWLSSHTSGIVRFRIASNSRPRLIADGVNAIGAFSPNQAIRRDSIDLQSLSSISGSALDLAEEQHHLSKSISHSTSTARAFPCLFDKGSQLKDYFVSPLIVPLMIIFMVLMVLLLTACAWTLGSHSLPVVSIAWASQMVLNVAIRALERRRFASRVDDISADQ
mmetsp:Transcript_25766/g.48882  ORF Transcript_25766/g.48882 Transcript_25766/m.48882 type:complete len:201 (+) Transcript_25766:431-1033(+)